MKQVLTLFIAFLFFASYGQEKKTSIEKIDTITLGDFEQKKVVRYSAGYVKICISAQDYIEGIEVFHNRYKKWSTETKKSERDYEFYITNFRVIDSVYKSVKLQIKTKDTVDVSQRIFDRIGLGSLVNFDYFIDKKECAIYDGNGIRQYRIIRKHESYYVGPLNAWGGRRYYFLTKNKYFYEATDWIS